MEQVNKMSKKSEVRHSYFVKEGRGAFEKNVIDEKLR